jgi:hypothetical protein
VLNQCTQDKVREFQVIDGPEETVVADAFGLVEPDHRFGHCVVEGLSG